MYKGVVPNQRAENQTCIAFACEREFLRAMDQGRRRIKLDRSKFIRKAIKAELRRLGQFVPEEVAAAPDRATKVRYPVNEPSAWSLNDSSKPEKGKP